MDPITAKIKHAARRMGFTLVGVTGPDPPPHLDVYQGWIGAGRHGEMHYLATERAQKRRADPREILPECKSILVVAKNYLTERDRFFENNTPKVSSYALGEDYHLILVSQLKALVTVIQTELGQPFPHRIYTDTGPILERELAQRAGLGWIGKNTCLIHPRHGSTLVLGEILLGIELDPDTPFSTDRCGSCTRCIDHCPTQCIRADRTLDARHCISYLTIELKASIPAAIRPQMGNWVFGCDLCQQVCPWNIRFASETPDEAFQPRPFLHKPSLIDFLNLSPEDFRREMQRSPLKRPKREGVLRNACIAAGNQGDSSLLNALHALLLNEEDPMLRAHAAWALGQIGGPASQEGLQKAREREENPEVIAEIVRALNL